MTMTPLRRLAALTLALVLLKLIRVLRLLVRSLRLWSPGPGVWGWRRMIRMRIALGLVRLSRAVLNLSGIVAPWVAGDDPLQ
jgi:hypothetical protein